jgi:hypothetical protein
MRNKKGQFSKGTSGNLKGRPRLDAGHVVQRVNVDGWNNLYSGVGSTTVDNRTATTFCSDIIDYSQAVELMKGDDTASRAVEKLPNDALRAGFDLLVSGVGDADGAAKEIQESVEQRWTELGVTQALREATLYERAYGGAAIMMGANDGQDIRTELDSERVKGLDFLTVFERREVTPLYYYDDPFAPKFRQVAIYRVSPVVSGVSDTGGLGSMPFEIHETRLIKFGGIKVGVENSGDSFGESIFTRLWRVLRDFNGVWDSASVLANDFSQAIWKIKGLAEMVVSDDATAFRNRLKALELGRGTVRAAVLDTEEEFERKGTPMGGFPELLDRFESRVAAAIKMPVTVLFGRSPSGLNATGESDLQIWHESIADYRDQHLIPPLTQLTGPLLAEAGASPDTWEIVGRPIKEESANDTAVTRKLHAETAAILITSGVLFPEEVADSMFGGDNYSGDIVVDFDERDKLEAKAEKAQLEADKQALEMANAGTPDPNDPAAQPEGDAEDQPDEGEEE